MKSVKEKNQKLLNRFLKADEKYNSIVDSTEDNGGMKQERAYTKANDLFLELPKYERKNLGELALGYGE